MPPNTIERGFGWLQRALQLRQPVLPPALEVDAVVPVVEVMQQGWHDASWQQDGRTVGASSAAGDVILIERDTTAITVVLALDLRHAGGAGNRRMNVLLTEPNGGSIHFGSPDVPINRNMSHAEIFGTTRPFVVPPNYRLQLNHPGTGVGETLSAFYVFARLPAGVQPL